MKVLNLRCAHGHGFEGWFGSEDDYSEQIGRGQIECPLCADKLITRLPSAPRLNLSGAREPATASSAGAGLASAAPGALARALPGAGKGEPPGAPSGKARVDTGVSDPRADPQADPQADPNGGIPASVDLQAAWLNTVRRLLAETEDVGQNFAEEARRIHYGEAEHRAIRGQTDAAERQALREEGIEVLSIPVPQALKGPVQ